MVTVKNLSKSFHDNKTTLEVLKDISVDIPDNGITIIIGKSGSGKTTFLNALGGLETYQGTITYRDGHVEKGKSSAEFDSYRSLHIGYIFQNFLLFGEETVEENVKKSLDIAGIVNLEEKKKRIQNALKAVGLWLYRRRKAADLSLGQKQRVAIARAIAVNPDILLADEPTGNLDSVNARIIMDILKDLSKKIPVVCVTHNDNLSYLYGDTFFFMKDGKLKPGSRDELEVSDEVKNQEIVFDAPKLPKLNVIEKVESFKILVVNGVKKIVLPNNYVAISEETANRTLNEFKIEEERQSKGQPQRKETTQFDTSSFNDSLKNKGKVKLFGKRKHKGQKLIFFISFILAVILSFILNIAFLYNSYSSNALYAFDSNTVGAIYDKEDEVDASASPLKAKQKMELMKDPNSGIVQFLDQSMRLRITDLVMDATSSTNSNEYMSSPNIVFFLSNEDVSDSFALRGDKPSSLKDHEVLMDESLLNYFPDFSKYGTDKNNYLNTMISIDGSTLTDKQYKIVGFTKSNLPSFIFKASKEEVNRGISSYRAIYSNALSAFDNLQISYDSKYFPANDSSSEDPVLYYLSSDVYSNLLMFAGENVSYPSEEDISDPSKMTIYNLLQSSFPHLSNLIANTPIKEYSQGLKNTLFINESKLSSYPQIRYEISEFILFLINPAYSFNNGIANYGNTIYQYFKYDVSPLSNDKVTPIESASDDGPKVYVRKDVYDLLKNKLPNTEIRDTGFIAGTYEGPGALSYFASGDDLTRSLLSDSLPERPYYNQVYTAYQISDSTAIFIANDMSKVKALPKINGFSYYDFGEVVADISSRDSVGKIIIIVVFIVALLLTLLYALIYRSDMLVDSEKIGVYRCLGMKKITLLIHYGLFIGKKITLFFLIPYVIFTIFVTLMYAAYAPIYVLILVPVVVFVLSLGFGLLPTIITLQEEPRKLVKQNDA